MKPNIRNPFLRLGPLMAFALVWETTEAGQPYAFAMEKLRYALIENDEPRFFPVMITESESFVLKEDERDDGYTIFEAKVFCQLHWNELRDQIGGKTPFKPIEKPAALQALPDLEPEDPAP